MLKRIYLKCQATATVEVPDDLNESDQQALAENFALARIKAVLDKSPDCEGLAYAKASYLAQRDDDTRNVDRDIGGTEVLEVEDDWSAEEFQPDWEG